MVNVLVPRFKSNFITRLLPKKKSPFIRANLDELGSAAWLLIDGAKSVYDIGLALADKFEEPDDTIHERITLFLRELYTNGFISFNELNER